MTHTSDTVTRPPTRALAIVSRAGVIRAQVAFVAGVSLAAVVVGANYFRPSTQGLGNVPVIIAAAAPGKVRPGADFVADDDADVSRVVADIETPVVLPPMAPTRLVSRTVKTIRIAPDGTLLNSPESATLEARATLTRQALAGERTPNPAPTLETPAAKTPAPTPRILAAATPAQPTPVAETAPAPVIVVAPAPALPAQSLAASVTPAPAMEASQFGKSVIAKIIAAPPATEPMPESSPDESTIVAQSAAVPATSATRREAAVNTGFYFVQLAASGSEEEAQRLSHKLQAELGDNLGQRELLVFTGTVKDKTVYRVRVGELSREEANAMCQRIKGKKACFVAKD